MFQMSFKNPSHYFKSLIVPMSNSSVPPIIKKSNKTLLFFIFPAIPAEGVSPSSDSVRVGSPLTVPGDSVVGAGTSYILHPPLPQVPGPTPATSVPAMSTPADPATAQSSIPILLNPDLMKGTSIPFISPQVGAWSFLFWGFLFYHYDRVTTAQGKQGKWQQQKSLSGKTRGIWKFAETQGIWFAQVVNSLILMVKGFLKFAAKISKSSFKLDKSAKSVLFM